MNNWPEEKAIDNTGLNGEVPEYLTFEIGETLYRKNPTGDYALYWTGKAWRESATVTNAMMEWRE